MAWTGLLAWAAFYLPALAGGLLARGIPWGIPPGFTTSRIYGHYVSWKVQSAPVGVFACPQPLCGAALAVMPDARWVATSGPEGKVCLFSLETLQTEPAACFESKASISQLAVALDTRTLVASVGEAIQLWRLPESLGSPNTTATASLICEYPQGQHVQSITISPDGNWLASGFASGDIALWSLGVDDANPECPAAPVLWLPREGHRAPVATMVISHDSQFLVGGGRDGFVYMWGLTGLHIDPGLRAVRRFYHGAPVMSLALSHSGHWLFIGGADGKVGFWDMSTNTFTTYVDHGSPVLSLATSPEGAWLISASEIGAVRLWDVDGPGQPRAAEFLHGGAMAAATLTPDGRYLVTSDGGNRPWYNIYVWDLQVRSAGPVADYSSLQATGNVVGLLQLGTGLGHNRKSGDPRLLSASSDGVLTIWDLCVREQPPQSLKLPATPVLASIGSVAVTPDGMWLLSEGVTMDMRKVIFLWDLQSNTVVANLTYEASSSVSCLAIAPDHSRAASCANNTVYVWDLVRGGSTSGGPLAYLPVQGIAEALAVAPDGDGLLVGDSTGISLWSLRNPSGGSFAEFRVCGKANALAVSVDGDRFVSGGEGGQVCLWDLRNRSPIPLTRLQHALGDAVHSVALLGGDKVVSGGRQGTVCMWDLSADLLDTVLEIRARDNEVWVAATPDGAWLYTGGNDGQVRGWLLRSMAGYVDMLRASPWCDAGQCDATAVRVSGPSPVPVTLPNWLDGTPLRVLDLQHREIASISPTPPFSIVSVNFSGARVAHWQTMSSSWFLRPKWVDLRGTSNPVLPSITGRTPERRMCGVDCDTKLGEEDFCLTRGPQVDVNGTRHRCAKTFLSNGVIRGRRVDQNTIVFVDGFAAWLCDCTVGTYGPDGDSCTVCPQDFYCPAAGDGEIAENMEAKQCPVGSGTRGTGRGDPEACECIGGFFSATGHVNMSEPELSCTACQSGSFSAQLGSTSCEPCPWGFVMSRNQAVCSLDWPLLRATLTLAAALLLIGWATGRQLGGIGVDDVRQEGDAVVVTTCGRHWICDWYWPGKFEVELWDTGHPKLDAPAKRLRARCLLGGYRIELLCANGEPLHQRVDTSRGIIRPAFPFLLLFSGRPLPVCVTLPGMLALTLLGGIITLQKRHLALSALLALAIAGICRLCGLTMMASSQIKRRISEYRSKVKQLYPECRPCPRGPGRAVTAAQLWGLHEFFKTFIGDRDMYYVNENILKPVTWPERVSFAELVGPSPVTYFVSHFWGTPFQHLVASIVKHAQLVPLHVKHGVAGQRIDSLGTESDLDVDTSSGSLLSGWRRETYWICSLSNNQWDVGRELGDGDWARSSFYLALTSSTCRATVMVLDEEARPLSRAWCLFEVLQTFILLKRRPGFLGLLLSTPTGVLNYPGHASVDAAMAVAVKLAHIRMENAEASHEGDKRMISELVLSYEGGFETMNRFIRNSIREALQVIQSHHNKQFDRLTHMLQLTEDSRTWAHTFDTPPIRDTLLVTRQGRSGSDARGVDSESAETGSDSEDEGTSQVEERSDSDAEGLGLVDGKKTPTRK